MPTLSDVAKDSAATVPPRRPLDVGRAMAPAAPAAFSTRGGIGDAVVRSPFTSSAPSVFVDLGAQLRAPVAPGHPCGCLAQGLRLVMSVGISIVAVGQAGVLAVRAFFLPAGGKGVATAGSGEVMGGSGCSPLFFLRLRPFPSVVAEAASRVPIVDVRAIVGAGGIPNVGVPELFFISVTPTAKVAVNDSASALLDGGMPAVADGVLCDAALWFLSSDGASPSGIALTSRAAVVNAAALTGSLGIFPARSSVTTRFLATPPGSLSALRRIRTVAMKSAKNPPNRVGISRRFVTFSSAALVTTCAVCGAGIINKSYERRGGGGS